MAQKPTNSNPWGSAKDPKSGRIYYYNIITKETTWTKPIELATPEERADMLRKRSEMMRFFEDMEANIYKRMNANPETDCYNEDTTNSYYDREVSSRPRLGSVGGITRQYRTISTIGESDLMLPAASSLAAVGRNTIERLPLPPHTTVHKIGLSDQSESKGESKNGYEHKRSAVSPPYRTFKKQQRWKLTVDGKKRRNSTGTIYLSSTMSEQNNESTIKVVCVVIRAHMINAAKEGLEPRREYEVFKDAAYVQLAERGIPSLSSSLTTVEERLAEVPSLETVTDFFKLIFSKSQLESECIIMALIYCERLVKEKKGRLVIRFDNWRSILFACLVMASKVWDDMSMWNVDFSQVCPSFNLQRINELELAILEELRFQIRVSASEYAKYYFHLRSMTSKLGLLDDNKVTEPLDIRGARKLQIATEKFEQEEGHAEAPRRRTRTCHAGDGTSSDEHMVTVGLEQLVHSVHVDADGLAHTSKAKKFSTGPAAGNRTARSHLNSICEVDELTARK